MKLLKSSFTFFCFLLLLPGFRLSGQSLWNSDFKGYIISNSNIKVGDVVIVNIDDKTSLSFSSVKSGNRQITLQFTGGETGNLFSFLPEIRTGNNDSDKGNEKVSLSSRIATRVIEILDNGLVRINGSRNLSLGNESQSITVSGFVNVSDLKTGNVIDFSKVVDATLTYKTLLQPGTPLITANDMEEIMQKTVGAQNIGTQNAGTQNTAAQPGATQPGTAPPGTTQPGAAQSQRGVTYKISDAKKKELILLYLNKMIQLIFQ